VGEMRSAYKILVRKPEGKRQIERLGCGWENFRIDLKEIGLKIGDWMHLIQDRDVVTNRRIP
jgi:hypothetical protein